MKTIHFLTLILTALFISACNSSEIHEFASMEELLASLKPNEKIAWMLKVPAGTEISHKNGNVHIQLPENVTAWCYDSASETWVQNTSLDYNCKCHSGQQKCSPYTLKGQVGCITEINDPCTDCRGTVTDKDPGTGPHNFSSIIYDYNNINSIMTFGATHTLRPVTAAEIDNPELTGDLFEWLNGIMEKHKDLYAHADFSDDRLPAGFGVVPQTITKNILSDDPDDFSVVYILVPQCVIEEEGLPEFTQVRYFSNDDMVSDRDGSSKMSCSGSCAEGDCTLKSYAGGIVKGCEGCKSGCTLHIQ